MMTKTQASKMEQALMNQTLQVQNEKRKLESELEDVQVTKTWFLEHFHSGDESDLVWIIILIAFDNFLFLIINLA